MVKWSVTLITLVSKDIAGNLRNLCNPASEELVTFVNPCIPVSEEIGMVTLVTLVTLFSKR